MSAYVVEDETINKILAGLTSLSLRESWLTHPLKPFGFNGQTPSGQSPTRDQLRDLGAALFALNCLGVNERYGHGEAKEFRALNYTYVVTRPPSPIQLYKSIGCLRYQCSEGEAVNHPLYLALDAVYNHLAHYLVSQLDQYETATWG